MGIPWIVAGLVTACAAGSNPHRSDAGADSDADSDSDTGTGTDTGSDTDTGPAGGCTCDEPANSECDCEAPPFSVLADAPGLSSVDSVVWTGDGFGLAGADYRDIDLSHAEIYFYRLDESGAQIGDDVRVTTRGSCLSPALAWNGVDYGLVWEDWSTGDAEVDFAPLGADGSLGAVVSISDAPSVSRMPAIAWNGSGYGVAWWDDRSGAWEPWFAIVDGDGTVSAPPVRVSQSSSSGKLGPVTAAALVWSGTEYAVAWGRDRGGIADNELYFRRVDSDGGPAGDEVLVAPMHASTGRPSLAWTGAEYGLTWEADVDGIQFVRVAADGTLVGEPSGISCNDNAHLPQIVWAGGTFGVAWHAYDGADYGMTFAQIDADGVKLAGDIVVPLGDSQAPEIAWTGSRFAVTFNYDPTPSMNPPYDTEARFALLECAELIW